MARGGIRYGAGRPHERQTVEQAMAIDVRRLQRDGCLIPRTKLQMSWNWQQWDGAITASIGVTVDEHELSLSYSIDGVPAQQTIWRDSTHCHFGGCRNGSSVHGAEPEWRLFTSDDTGLPVGSATTWHTPASG